MKKRVLSVLLAGAMTLALAACGGSSGASSDSGSASADAGSAGDGSAEAVAEAAADWDGEEIIIGDTSIYDTLIPFQGGTENSNLIYEYLGAIDSFSGEFYGILIKDYEQVDDKTYNVTIYDYITDSEGNPITADDVIFSWQEAKNVGQLSEISTVDVDNLKKIDDYTVQFTWFDTPIIGEFEARMASVYIVSQKAYEEHNGMTTEAVGTGPYVVSEYSPGSSITLTAREDYWQPADKITIAKYQAQPVKTIRIDTITESSQLTMALQTGAIDMSEDITSQDVGNFQAGGAYSDVYTAETIPGTKGYVLYPNLSDGNPMADINLRKALFAAVDIDFISQSIQNGNCDPLYAMGSSQFSDYNEAWADIHPKYDLDAAKEYLAQSNYNGEELRLVVIAGMGYLQDVAEIIQMQAAAAGINISVDAQQIGNFLANEGDPNGWDLTIAHLESDDYITTCWAKYFDTRATGMGTTKNFLVDSELQSLMETCNSVEGHTQANIDATWEYITENAYCDPLINPHNFVVYSTGKIGGVAYSGKNILQPNGFDYKN